VVSHFIFEPPTIMSSSSAHALFPVSAESTGLAMTIFQPSMLLEK